MNFSLQFFRKQTRQPEVLVSHGDVIWKVTLLFLFALLVGALLFDGYIFLFRVENLEGEIIDAGSETVIFDVKKQTLGEAKEILERRAAVFATSTAGDFPSRNPFKEEKLKK